MDGLSCSGGARWFAWRDVDKQWRGWQRGVQSDPWDWRVVHMVWGCGGCREQGPVVVVLWSRCMSRADGSAGVYVFNCYRRRGCIG